MSFTPKILGGLILPRQLECAELDQSAGIAQIVKTTLAGNPVIYSRTLQTRPLTLTAREGVAWFTREQVDALLEMAKTPDGRYTLEWAGTSRAVVFRHDDPPALRFTPVYPFAERLFGEIKLLVLS